MRCVLCWVALAAATVVLAAAISPPIYPEHRVPGVTELKGDTFFDVVGGDRAVLVNFYAPWSYESQQLFLEYTKLGARMELSVVARRKLVVAKIDCTKRPNRDVCTSYGVTSYPTMLFFPAGSTTDPTPYENSEVKLKDLHEFLSEHVDSLTLHMPTEGDWVVPLDADNFDSIVLDSEKDALVLFNVTTDCRPCYLASFPLAELARAYRAEENVVVGVVHADISKNAEIISRYKIDEFPTVLFFPRITSIPLEFKGGLGALNFFQYMGEMTGKVRLPDGTRPANYGIRDELVAAVVSVAKAPHDSEAMDALKAQAHAALELNTPQEATDYYVKVGERIAKDGSAEYVTKELTRLETVDKLAAALKRQDSMRLRENILRAVKEAMEAV